MKVKLMSLTENAEDIIERACRTCYLSWHRYAPPGTASELIRKVIRKGHHSVLEHASATFRIQGCSRVMTHELVRHRLASYSQESQRYCVYNKTPNRAKTKDYEYVTPESILVDTNQDQSVPPDLNDVMLGHRRKGQPEDSYLINYHQLVALCQQYYSHLLDLGVPPEDARYILPNATTSEIVVSANLREWRHIFFMRCNPRAHWEIRAACMEIFRVLKTQCPDVFFDYHDGGDHIVIGEDNDR